MALQLNHLSDLARAGFDQVIDVRSPSEWAEDHLPGAINLPVLDDTERARVGTIYTQESRFLARRIGAALVARNAARHLEGPLADRPASYRPLVYCWRGGQRSGSFASILGQIGWRVEILAGGYKTWRRLVVGALYEAPVPAPVVVLDGNTGTAKTALLGLLAARGVQSVDLEGLAQHRGSVFGARAGGQPSQKAFESALALALSRLDPARPVVIEAESSKIGRLMVPPQLWSAICAAPRLRIEAPLSARAAYLTRAYADLLDDTDHLAGLIDRLRSQQAAVQIEAWQAMARQGAYTDLAAGLMAAHYDPRYARQRARHEGRVQRTLVADDLTPAALDDLAERLAALVTGPLSEG
jgi:tRNA 2-selenouridine synthase